MSKRKQKEKSTEMTWVPSVSKKNGPLYKEICRQLRSDIESGALPPGTKLPPQRDLAAKLGINISTVSRAFRICEEEGLLTSTVGSGTFVAAGAVVTSVTSAHTGKSGTVELGVLAPRLIDHDALVSILKETAHDEKAGGLFEYEYDSTDNRHRAAAVKLITRAGSSASPESILFAQGTQNAVAASIFAFMKPGDRLGCDPLVFPTLKRVCSLAGVRLVPIRWENGEMSEKGLDYAIGKEGLKALFVMPEYQVPTAHTMSRSCRQLIAEKAKKHSLIVIEAAMSALSEKGATGSIAKLAPENTIFITGLSTMIAPGLRCAYMSAPERYHEPLDSALKTIDTSPSPLLLDIASRVVLGSGFEGMIETVRQRARARGKYVKRSLGDIVVGGDDFSPFKWCRIPGDIDPGLFEKAAHDAGVQIQGAHRFTVGQADPPPAFRICHVSPKNERDLARGLDIIKETIAKFV